MRHSRPSKIWTSERGRQWLPLLAGIAAGVTVVAAFAGCSAGKPSAGRAVTGAAVPGQAGAGEPGAVKAGAVKAGAVKAGAAQAGGAVKAEAGDGGAAGGGAAGGGAAGGVALRHAAQAAEDGSRVLPVDPGAGRLRQTQAFPSTHDAAFRDAMDDLWLAITRDRPDYASQAFFPEAAYTQVKAIGDPAGDWTGRLWLDFELDVHAAHYVVGSDAHLVRVDMAPDWEAAWVSPGYCYNAVGYWHINGARLVYDRYGEERSIGIASLISWRGDWYVVHFGGVIRPAVGIVDDPEAGPGYTGPAGGC
jgi:hypothetical protein